MDNKRRAKVPRYDDDDYARAPEPRRSVARGVREERAVVYARDPRDDPRSIDERDIVMDDRVDPRRDPRDIRDARDPRANAGARLEPRRERAAGARAELDVYQDPRTGGYYRQEPPVRQGQYRDESRYDNPAPGRVIESVVRDSSEKYNDYFVPGDGIDREVIQNEITRFLGQDATVRPQEYKGKPGFMIKAYRALTTEMIRSLKEETLRFNKEREKRQRTRQPAISYNAYQASARPEVEAPQYRDDDMMDVDDDPRYIRDYPQERGIRDPRDPRDPRDLVRDPRGDARMPREIRELRDPRDARDPKELRDQRDLRDLRDLRDPRDPRGDRDPYRDIDPRMVAAGRLPVTTGYAPDPGYTTYVPSPAGPYVPETQPRTMYVGGGSTPPTGRLPPGGYSQAGYPSRTGISAPPTTASIAYGDVGYPPEPRRHRDGGRR